MVKRDEVVVGLHEDQHHLQGRVGRSDDVTEGGDIAARDTAQSGNIDAPVREQLERPIQECAKDCDESVDNHR